MDMLDNNFSGSKNDSAPLNDFDKPIPLGGDDTAKASVSRAPLNLGGSSPNQPPKTEVTKPAIKQPMTQTTPAGRITSVKTFFTKLHPGAMEFLDEQIAKWLKENPTVAVKQTNITTGDVQAKKTEPNIIITVWY
jgi:hypothetical protein